ncbi:glycosyltransferase [Tsukamurella soli]|uniref:Glycosyl transferase family 28 C-terminal domain-containing protein n=1 Tax=Tsukamurella soli TaxID=644556 RepID=A0ABP8JX87_9ACTN
MTGPTAARVVATLGTDHHLFDRLVGWLDAWAAETDAASVLVQYGHSAAPRVAEGVPMLPREVLLTEIRDARIVVTHGGTGSVMEARAAGHVPIVVPRTEALSEHVDDHQVGFARRMAGLGWVHVAETESELREHLGRALADPSAYRLPGGGTPDIAAVPAVDALMADVLRRPPGTVSPRRVGQVLGYLRRRRS